LKEQVPAAVASRTCTQTNARNGHFRAYCVHTHPQGTDLWSVNHRRYAGYRAGRCRSRRQPRPLSFRCQCCRTASENLFACHYSWEVTQATEYSVLYSYLPQRSARMHVIGPAVETVYTYTLSLSQHTWDVRNNM